VPETAVGAGAALTAPEIRFDAASTLAVGAMHVVAASMENQLVSTLAGTGRRPPSTADQQGAVRIPHSIAFDAAGNLLVCDIGNSRVRAIDMKTGTMSTFAGTDGAPLQGRWTARR
jgi:hypothetical protein